jgi:biopolymer transport protein ExbB/biopolymer transport protein TolQ
VTILLSILGSKALGFFAFLFQEAAKGGEDLKSAFTITEMVKNLGWVALTVIVILLIMSMYSIAIMVERFLTYSAAKKQSREFAPRVAQALKNDRIEEAINISDKHKKSHLAMVVNAGLQEFRAHDASSDISGDEIEASKRALQRAIAIKSAEFKRGLSGLATIGSTAPFVGLFGTVFGIISSTTEPFCHACDRSRLTADGLWYLCLYANHGTDLRKVLRSGASDEELAQTIRSIWARRADRGAELRLASGDRSSLIPIDRLKKDPHLEMHTRGG